MPLEEKNREERIKTNTYNVRDTWDMVHLTLDRKTVERRQVIRVVKDRSMGHHPDLIPRRLQIQPRGDLNLFILLIYGRGQDMDPIEERARKVLADGSDRVLELVHVPEPIRRQVSSR